jgi:hypothetical protein
MSLPVMDIGLLMGTAPISTQSIQCREQKGALRQINVQGKRLGEHSARFRGRTDLRRAAAASG